MPKFNVFVCTFVILLILVLGISSQPPIWAAQLTPENQFRLKVNWIQGLHRSGLDCHGLNILFFYVIEVLDFGLLGPQLTKT